jgi:hypothetical protein
LNSIYREKVFQLSDFSQRALDRLQVMAAVYEAASGSATELVSLWDVRDALAMGDARMADAVGYLEEKALIQVAPTMTGQRAGAERWTGGDPQTPQCATLTASGVSEVARAERMPDQPTQYLPPLNNITIHVGGSVYGSPFQVASPGASQVVETRVETVAVGDMNRVRAFLTEYNAGHRVLTFSREMEPDAFTEFSCEMETLVAQLRSPRPKAATIRLSLSTIRRLIVQVPGEDTLALLGRLDQIDI